ncbi:MAG: glycosyltransferase family 4 protein [Methylacidiphilales bacterium]|nr:glycosyltransferase family 4 protein [Candidatus Methylacidiphilales bacterium]
MTIGFLLNTSEPYYRGGYEQRALSFGRALVRQGHDVCVYTSCPCDETVEGIRFVRLAPPRPYFNARGVRNGWADILFAFDILKLLWQPGIRDLDVLDVCATPFIHLPFVAVVSWFRRVPVVITCHEALLISIPAYTRERGNRNPVIAWLFTRIFILLYRLGMGLFCRRLANSRGTFEALAKEGYPASGIVETGIDQETYNTQPPEPLPETEPVRFVFCGRLTPIKSVDQSLAALFPLCDEPRAFHFDIVGDGAERSRLERMVREADAEKWITFHGQVPDETKRAILAGSEIFILSSPREGLSLATIEAMAGGCGALIVNDPKCPTGALDFVRHGQEGLVVLPGVEPMRTALRLLLRDAPLRLALRRAAWQTAQAYHIETQAEKLAAFYRQSCSD